MENRFWLAILFLLFSFSSVVESAAVVSHLNEKDLQNLKTVFLNVVANPSDVAVAFYGAGGLKLLHEKISENDKLCALAKKHETATDIGTIFHASALAFVLDNCKYTNAKAPDAIKTTLTDAKSTQELYYAAYATKHLGLPIYNEKLSTGLTASLKKDDSVASLGYAFHVATLLEGNAVSTIFNRIEDCVAQADEVDGKYLQFEGGVSVSAVVISGIYDLADKANKTPNVKADATIKLANFLLNHKGVPLVRLAYHLLRALKALTTNKYHVPVAFSLASPLALSSSQKVVRVKVCDVLGKSIGSLGVTVDTATHVSSSGVVLSKKALTAVADDQTKTLYEFNFLEAAREKGFYVLTLSAASPSDKRLIGTQGAEIAIKVMTEIEGAEVAVVDREQSEMGSRLLKLLQSWPKVSALKLFSIISGSVGGGTNLSEFSDAVAKAPSLADSGGIGLGAITEKPGVELHPALVIFLHFVVFVAMMVFGVWLFNRWEVAQRKSELKIEDVDPGVNVMADHVEEVNEVLPQPEPDPIVEAQIQAALVAQEAIEAAQIAQAPDLEQALARLQGD